MDGDCGGYPTYFVVCLHRPCTQEAANFIVDILSSSQNEGGAELIVRQEKMPASKTGLVLHVSATKSRLYELAETIDIKKPDISDGVIRGFTTENAHDFADNGIEGPLTLSDVHKCVLHAMESVHFDADQKYLPGHHSSKRFMKRSPVLSAYREAGLIDTFPLHDDEMLTKVYAEWKQSAILNPPIELIRDYFGENVALYVSFTSFYTKFLIPIAILGVLQFLADKLIGYHYYDDVVFSLLNLIAVTIFLEFWKRRSNEHCFKWGTGGKLRHKRSRPEFRGEYGLNPITGRSEVQYPVKKTLKKLIFVSIPITFCCLLVAFVLMLLSFQCDIWIVEMLTDQDTGELPTDLVTTALTFVPTVLYSALVYIMNLYYLHLAHNLTEWENHRTQEQFERYVVAKLILFEFVNTFLSLFYIAFYMRDIVMLKSQVSTMLIVLQIVNQMQETILPIFLRRPSTRKIMNKMNKHFEDDKSKPKKEHKLAEQCLHCEVEKIQLLPEDDAQLAHSIFSLKKDPYESTYDDFMELWLQFGHVFLLGTVYPLAAFLALANNIFELKMDAYKLCKLARKPTPRGVRDIGAWYTAFNVTIVFSVMTNCALLSMDKDLRNAFGLGLSDLKWVLLFVGLEHIILTIRVMIDKLISDVPSNIKHAMDRDDFILKNQKK